MDSIFQSVARLVGTKRRQSGARPDEEQATIAPTLPPLPPTGSHPPTAGHRAANDDALALFRLMLGITAAPHLGFSASAARPADNVGLYARVVHAEQTAKDSYKVFSAIINACYFAQIIVAAALTALGAANADNKAVTAFGAINTIIAGFLTYLKGSGYPARLKYYASEWKKVREFIEHRERDFSLEGCDLDVYEVVDAVRDMYENTKREIEMNTPDSYNSKFGGNGVDSAKAEAIANKLRGLDDTIGKLAGHLGSGGPAAKSAEALGSLHGLNDTVRKLRAGGLDSKSDGMAVHLRALDDTAQKLRGDVSAGVEEKSVDLMVKLRHLEDALDKVRSRVEQAAHEGRDAANRAASDVAHSAADVILEEKKRATEELRDLGNAAIREVEEHKPRPPHEVSITLSHSHRDGTGQGEGERTIAMSAKS